MFKFSMEQEHLHAIRDHLVNNLHYPSNTKIRNFTPLHGGSINQIGKLDLKFQAHTDNRHLFKTLVVKKNTGRAIGFFGKEQEGLIALNQVVVSNGLSLKVPRPFAVLVGSTKPALQYLFLEYIETAYTFSPTSTDWNNFAKTGYHTVLHADEYTPHA